MFNQRITNVQTILNNKKLDGLLISNFYNILYLTGFKTLTKHEREAWALVTNNSIYLFTDGRYINKLRVKSEKLKVSVKNLKLLTSRQGLIFYLEEIIKKEKLNTIGFEEEDLRVGELRRLKDKLHSVNFIPIDKLVLKQREIKDQDEVKKIKKACEIGDQCLREIIPTINLGQTEKEIAFRIEFWLKKKGYNFAFPPLIAIDQNSSIPHYNTQTGFRKLKKGSIVLIDFGVNYQDYLSDITRMIFFGKPKNEIIYVYHKLLKTQKRTIKQCNNISKLKDIDQYCRLRITDYGLLNYPHSTGHGVGLEIHEYPKISQSSTDTIQRSQVFTIEPGVYFPGKFGMRIEDTVAITSKLKIEVLTKFTKQPIFL